ncbi:UNKNOWN [Stylonychia lemnae]|uniref:Uncharacterized protein n=1 Tax=Stylonychia lemnae TaxID=5949 RepID=A0A078AJI4_STYLE|nr:UNKNOWN [Stylonychia lemnae]|eukprot:CDW80948.1 UNKNOWN [Stylonychia lemnae]
MKKTTVKAKGDKGDFSSFVNKRLRIVLALKEERAIEYTIRGSKDQLLSIDQTCLLGKGKKKKKMTQIIRNIITRPDNPSYIEIQENNDVVQTTIEEFTGTN